MGLRTLAPLVDVVVVVDVLSFTTCVDVALGRGAVLFPYPWRDGSEGAFAESVGAVVASRQRDAEFSLSPASLEKIPAHTRLVLPSPNGSALLFGAVDAGATTAVAACIRNGAAIGSWFADQDVTVGVIAAGERWGQGGTGPMRVALEDLWGAGCVLSLFAPDDLSPEARMAANAWRAAERHIVTELEGCSSGRELIGIDHAHDVALAGAAHVSELVPALNDGCFVDLAAG